MPVIGRLRRRPEPQDTSRGTSTQSKTPHQRGDEEGTRERRSDEKRRMEVDGIVTIMWYT